MAHPVELRALITGISGFTGRHLAATLGGSGWEVAGLGSERQAMEVGHLCADITETEALGAWIAEIQPTHIVHLAAKAHVVGDPLEFYRVNVLGTESLLESIARSGVVVKKVLIASSANVYGNAEHSPITEATPLRPLNHYARSKVAMEQLVQGWFDRLPISIVRPFNYTGPGQSEAFLFSKIVGSFRRNDSVIRLGNLNVTRDLADITYVCEAYRRLLLSTSVGDVVNVCTGTSVSLAQALETMREIAGFMPRMEVDSTLLRKEDIAELRGDPTKLYELIGRLEPLDLRQILSRMFTTVQPDPARQI